MKKSKLQSLTNEIVKLMKTHNELIKSNKLSDPLTIETPLYEIRDNYLVKGFNKLDEDTQDELYTDRLRTILRSFSRKDLETKVENYHDSLYDLILGWMGGLTEFLPNVKYYQLDDLFELQD